MKKTVLLLMLCLLVFSLGACMQEERTPREGTWYCAELQVQFSVDLGNGYVSQDFDFVVDESVDYAIVDGDRIAICPSNDPGSIYIYINCREKNNPKYGLGDSIYKLRFVSLSDTEYVLEDEETGKQYTFIRVGDSPDNSVS